MAAPEGSSLDPRATHAPDVLEALQLAVASVRQVADTTVLELVRRREAMLLSYPAELEAEPWGVIAEAQATHLAQWAIDDSFDEPQRLGLALAEQFAIDVTGVAAGPLAPAASTFGASILPLVQGLFLIDLGQRCALALGALFDLSLSSDDWATPRAGLEVPADPMAAVGELLRRTALLHSVDPVTREMVRLRGAHHHECRRCQSVRSVAAIEAGADETLLAVSRPGFDAEASPRVRAALALTDAVLRGTVSLVPSLLDELHARFTDEQLVELVCYLMRNSANKIAVAFAADGALVEDGFEYQAIDELGETLTVAHPGHH